MRTVFILLIGISAVFVGIGLLVKTSEKQIVIEVRNPNDFTLTDYRESGVEIVETPESNEIGSEDE